MHACRYASFQNPPPHTHAQIEGAIKQFVEDRMGGVDPVAERMEELPSPGPSAATPSTSNKRSRLDAAATAGSASVADLRLQLATSQAATQAAHAATQVAHAATGAAQAAVGAAQARTAALRSDLERTELTLLEAEAELRAVQATAQAERTAAEATAQAQRAAAEATAQALRTAATERELRIYDLRAERARLEDLVYKEREASDLARAPIEQRMRLSERLAKDPLRLLTDAQLAACVTRGGLAGAELVVRREAQQLADAEAAQQVLRGPPPPPDCAICLFQPGVVEAAVTWGCKCTARLCMACLFKMETDRERCMTCRTPMPYRIEVVDDDDDDY